MKINKKYTKLFIILSIVSAINIGAMVFSSMWATSTMVDAISMNTTVTSSLKNHLESDMMHDAIRGDVLFALKASSDNDHEGIKQARVDLDEHAALFIENVEKNKKLPLPTDIKELLEQVVPIIKNYEKEAYHIMDLADKDYQAAKSYFATFMTSFEALEEAMGAASDKIEENVEKSDDGFAALENKINIILNALSIIAIVVCIAGPLIIINKLFKPINIITEQMSKLSANDTSIHVDEYGDNEIGAIAKSLIKLKKAVIENLLLQQMTSEYPVIRCDRNMNVIYFNHAALRILSMLGYDERQLQNIPIGSLHNEFNNKSDTNNLIVKINDQWLETNIRSIRKNNNFDGVYLNVSVVTEKISNENLIKLAQSGIQTLANDANCGLLNSRIDSSQFNGFYFELSETMNNLMTTITKPIEDMINTMSKFSKGDLSAEIHAEYKGEFDRIKQIVNYTVNNLRNIISQVKNDMGNLKAISNQLSEASNLLGNRYEKLSSSLLETTESMEQITSTVKGNAENTRNATKLAKNASDVAEIGGTQMNELTGAMKNIEGSSRKISEIIGVIDEIAFQTNLLAINAAVEAARAGEVGKGFSVVAGEVRALAGRSATASKEIKQLINQSSSLINNGVELASSCKDTLGNIVTSVNEVNNIISDIAKASDQQSQSIIEINKAINDMGSINRDNMGVIESNKNLASNLENSADILYDLVDFFKNEGVNNNFIPETKKIANS